MLPRRKWSRLTACLLAIALSVHPLIAQTLETPETVAALLQQSHQRYEAGQLDAARALLQRVQQQAQEKKDALTLAIALSNLALIDNDQGNWTAANQAIAESRQALKTVPNTPTQQKVLAQVLNMQGRLQLTQGHAETALQTWKQAAILYQQLGDRSGEIQSQLRQVEALQALGFYDRAYEEILRPLRANLSQQPDSSIKAWALRSLGETLGIVGDLVEAQKTLEESVAIAQRLQNPQETAASQLTLANLLFVRIRDLRSANSGRAKDKEELARATTQAIALYTKVAATPSTNRLRAALNQLALLLDSDRVPEATQLATTLQPEILNLPPDRRNITARLNFANSLLRLQKLSETQPQGITDSRDLTQLLTTAADQAKTLNDLRLQANALGLLGRLQEQNQQFLVAQTTTAQALLLVQSTNALDQVYRWSVQVGRLQEKQGDREGAIASYTQAVNTLRTLRSDLLGLNSYTQLVDQESLEPVHRQLVSLLLPKDGSQPDSKTLKQAQGVIESLQLEEINNYLRAACLPSQVDIDKVPVPNKTAVIYPMILPDRIAIIVSITGGQETKSGNKQETKQETQKETKQETKLYNQSIPQATVEETVKAFQQGLRNRISLEYKKPSEQLYRWLIQPIEETLKQQQVETVVFVLDGAFRKIPMAALFDGQKFLIEKYSIATTPGLKLTSPQPLQAKVLSTVAFGMTEARTIELPNGGSKSFSELPNVQSELEDLQKEISPSIVRLNEKFTRAEFQKVLQNSQSPIVHLATHGQFSSNRDQTFLLASDGVIDTDQLTIALGAGSRTQATPIELLVLSACETASGDDRAPLGLAGIALKSGARSTVASLWKVNDTATSLLMQRFYKELATREVSKADALQRAQREILNDPQFRGHPYYWAPFILVGNWL